MGGRALDWGSPCAWHGVTVLRGLSAAHEVGVTRPNAEQAVWWEGRETSSAASLVYALAAASHTEALGRSTSVCTPVTEDDESAHLIGT